MVTQHHHRVERLLAAWPRTSTPCSSRSRFSRVLTTSISGKRSQERSTSRPFSNSSTGSSNRQKSKLFAKNKDWMTICITRYYCFPVEVDCFSETFLSAVLICKWSKYILSAKSQFKIVFTNKDD